jgi:hypothetical protein
MAASNEFFTPHERALCAAPLRWVHASAFTFGVQRAGSTGTETGIFTIEVGGVSQAATVACVLR